MKEINFKVWKTVLLGTVNKSVNDFLRAFEDGGYGITNWANSILDSPAFMVATEPTEVDLVRRTVAQFGFEKGASRKHIYEEVATLGLAFCPPEVGLQLRLQYKDQPSDERILVGMEPISTFGGIFGFFHVDRVNGVLCMGSSYGLPATVWNSDAVWVFVRPRKQICNA